MKVVIFCGGQGTRLKEETEYKPKPLVPIGNLPIVWHIMKLYSHYGFNDFILCLGYKGSLIKEFFMHYEWDAYDFTLNLQSKDIIYHNRDTENWNVTFVDTGLDAKTALRLKQVEKYIDGDEFMVTYGDGVANVDINALLDFHRKQGRMATITCMKPHSKYGVLRLNKDAITEFKEKPVLDDHINGGFMVFNKEVLSLLKENVMLVDKTLPDLATKDQLSGYQHNGFFHSMDTYKDFMDLNAMYTKGKRPWMVWEK